MHPVRLVHGAFDEIPRPRVNLKMHVRNGHEAGQFDDWQRRGQRQGNGEGEINFTQLERANVEEMPGGGCAVAGANGEEDALPRCIAEGDQGKRVRQFQRQRRNDLARNASADQAAQRRQALAQRNEAPQAGGIAGRRQSFDDVSFQDDRFGRRFDRGADLSQPVMKALVRILQIIMYRQTGLMAAAFPYPLQCGGRVPPTLQVEPTVGDIAADGHARRIGGLIGQSGSIREVMPPLSRQRLAAIDKAVGDDLQTVLQRVIGQRNLALDRFIGASPLFIGALAPIQFINGATPLHLAQPVADDNDAIAQAQPALHHGRLCHGGKAGRQFPTLFWQGNEQQQALHLTACEHEFEVDFAAVMAKQVANALHRQHLRAFRPFGWGLNDLSVGHLDRFLPKSRAQRMARLTQSRDGSGERKRLPGRVVVKRLQKRICCIAHFYVFLDAVTGAACL